MLPFVRVSALVALVALLGLWGCALWLWPGLPARIPVHFDGSGLPDRVVERSAGAWFLLPGIGTAMVLVFAFALPAWILRLAADNSPFLNVPRKQDFARLAPAARQRAIVPMIVLLRTIAAEVALVFGLILWGSARVASGAWNVLPPALVWSSIGALLATTLVSLPFGRRAVERELARGGTSESR
jgi:uncharacterized membrane protein